MGYSPPGRQESDTTERLHSLSLYANIYAILKQHRLEKNIVCLNLNFMCILVLIIA